MIYRVLPHYCNSTISSSAKKIKTQKYDDTKLTRPLSSKKNPINRVSNLLNTSYNSVQYGSTIDYRINRLFYNQW